MDFLFYAVDSVGIGHLSRCLGIAESLRKSDPAVASMILTEANNAVLLKEYPFPYFQVPPYESLFLNSKPNSHGENAGLSCWVKIIQAILVTYRPKLIIYDTYIWEPIFFGAKSINAKQVLIMRPRTDAINYLSSHHSMLKEFSLIVIPDDENHESNKLRLLSPTEVFYSGPILRRSITDINPAIMMSDFGFESDAINIVITNGGGNALPQKADDFISKVVSAFQSIANELPKFVAVCLPGPLEEFVHPFIKFKNGIIVFKEFEQNMLEMFQVADLVISRGGYNTILELTQIGTTAICIPADRETDDQSVRIANASINSPNIHPSKLDSNQIAQLLLHIINGGKQVRSPRLLENEDPIRINKNRLSTVLLKILKSQYSER